MEAQTKELQGKLMRAQQELDETRFHPEVSIGSAVASPSRSRSHTVDNAAFKEHSSLSENPAMMINDNEDIEFSSSDEEEAGGDTSRRSSQFKRGSKSMFSRQNSMQITDGIAEDLRTENDSLRVKLTQTELENEALQRKLKEKEREMGKQTTREMETIRRASAVYDTQTVPGQKGFWKGKRGRGNSKGNGEEMQTLVADLTARYSDLSLKFAEKCTEADELKHQLKRKDVEIVALKEIYVIPDILEQNNIWVSFRVFIPGDDDKGVPTAARGHGRHLHPALAGPAVLRLHHYCQVRGEGQRVRVLGSDLGEQEAERGEPVLQRGASERHPVEHPVRDQGQAGRAQHRHKQYPCGGPRVRVSERIGFNTYFYNNIQQQIVSVTVYTT